jgi:endothelin-converting enzyme/putative endopeptidase
LPQLRTYLRWAVARSAAPYLDQAMVAESYAFYRAYLRGVQQDQPRWKKCLAWLDRDLGESLGREFVARVFPEQNKQYIATMTRQIESAMGQRIEGLDWMTPATRKEALAKLASLRNKVGYPDSWRDYSALRVTAYGFFGNEVRASEFEWRRQAAKIGKPVDRSEWGMTPPTVNAYYDPQMNDINFPAGVLLPPLYDPKMDDAPNYGNTGGTIGHELTHGFDDEGRQFDAKGNLRDWWQKGDAQQFESRAQCVRDQYSSYTVVDDIHIQGQLTSGEDIADLGGEILALMAWREQTRNFQLEEREGLTPEQRFFVGFAQWACENERPENLRLSARTDPHSPGRYRINGVVSNMPEFAAAFHCKAGQAMVRPAGKACRVW